MKTDPQDLVRVARCLLLARSYGADSTEIAERLYGKTRHRHIPAMLHKAAVDTIGTVDTGGELFSPASVSTAFSEAVRTRSVLGQLATLPVPFSTPLTWISSRTTFGFVEERQPIPVTAPTFATPVTLKPKKCAGIIVTGRELLESSQAEEILSREMTGGCLEALDRALLDPDIVATDGSPASVSSASSLFYDASSATTPADIDGLASAMIAHIIAAGANLENAVFVTSLVNLSGLALLRTTGGDTPAYPGVTVKGGSLGGLPILGSAYAPADGLTLVAGDEILLADDQQTTIEVTEAAMISQDTDPASNDTWVSLFQADALGLKLTRHVNWSLRNPHVVHAKNFEIAPGTPATTE
jgi:HK97 family phage major capsid protein